MSKIINLGYHPKGINCSVSSVGATIMSCFYGDIPMIYPLHLRADGKNRGGVPICFPFFGPPHPDFLGEIGQHGWLRDQLLLADQAYYPYSALMVGSRYSAESSYPWHLAYHILHVVHNQMMQTNLIFGKMLDNSHGKAPVNPGFHHYFPNDGKTEVWIGEKCFTRFSAGAMCVVLKPKDVITINTGKLKMRMILTGFDRETCLYLWSDDSTKYFCVEPVLMPKEQFNTKQGCFLSQDGIKEMSVAIRVL